MADYESEFCKCDDEYCDCQDRGAHMPCDDHDSPNLWEIVEKLETERRVGEWENNFSAGYAAALRDVTLHMSA